MLRLERAACRWEIAHFSPSRPEPTRAGTTAPPTAVSSVGSGTKRIKRTDLRHRRSQGACGSSVAAVGTVNNDIGRYLGSVCLGLTAFGIGILRPWAARRGKDGA